MTRWKVLWDTPDYHEDGCTCKFCLENLEEENEMDSPLDIAMRIDALARKQGEIISAMQATLERAQSELELVRTGSCCQQCADHDKEISNG